MSPVGRGRNLAAGHLEHAGTRRNGRSGSFNAPDIPRAGQNTSVDNKNPGPLNNRVCVWIY